MLSNSAILITGGAGSLGHTFVPLTPAKHNPRRLVICSHDDMKQRKMAKLYGNDERGRISSGMYPTRIALFTLKGIDYIVHAAATKIVPTAKYNSFECVMTDVVGAMNPIYSCIVPKRKKLEGFDHHDSLRSPRH